MALVAVSCTSATEAEANPTLPPTTELPANTTAQTTGATPAASGETREVELVSMGLPKLDALVAALDAGDLQASKDALEAYDAVWNGIEVYVNVRSYSAYLKLEADLQIELEEGLGADTPDFPALKEVAEELAARYADTVAMSEQGPPLNLLFDDVATLRLVRAELRITNAALADGNVEKAAEYFTKFAEGFFDQSYPLIKDRNEEAGEEIEHLVDDAVAAFADPARTADELADITAVVLSNYNFGVSLVNAAARNADPAKAAVTTSDLLRLSQLHDVRIQLIKSYTAWQAGDFERAASVAEVAGTTAFSRVAPALAAKGGDKALKDLIDAYTELAGAAGDAEEVAAAQLAALRGVAVAEQVLLGQFWMDEAVQSHLAALPAPGDWT
ncbi:MAG: hypothetical protein Q7V88_17685 [Actinomycetota bacterium]|nr:hypothetical protein [Actinomycetota bacterium]